MQFKSAGRAQVARVLLAAVGVFGAASAAMAQSDEISVASGADPVSLDPRKTWVAQGYSMNAHVFEALAFRKDHPELDSNRLTLAQSLRGVGLALWDEAGQKLVSFREARTLGRG